jgi:hypothetical protein
MHRKQKTYQNHDRARISRLGRKSRLHSVELSSFMQTKLTAATRTVRPTVKTADLAKAVLTTAVETSPSHDRPLFRITDLRAGPATEVCLPALRPAVHADRRRCTWMYETRNETGQTLEGSSVARGLAGWDYVLVARRPAVRAPAVRHADAGHADVPGPALHRTPGLRITSVPPNCHQQPTTATSSTL